MRRRALLIAGVAAVLCCVSAGSARSARQLVAFFPLQNLADNSITLEVSRLGEALKEKLQDRLDVQPILGDGAEDPLQRKRKARGVGATYILTGAVSRIGRTYTLDLTIAATEDPAKGRTVVVTGADPGTEAQAGQRPVFGQMAIEAAAKLKYLFFGDELVGEGAARRKIPKLSGTVTRSRSIPGDVVSVAWGDTDKDGKPEIVAAYADGIAIYGLEEEDLREKARVPDGGAGTIHIDVADLDRNGTAEIVAVRYAAGKALSDIWEHDGKQYRPVARDIPYFVRAVDLGREGVVLVGQESDPVVIFRGPVFRLALNRSGTAERKEKDAALPLPAGTWIYSFAAIKNGGKLKFVIQSARDRLTLLDEGGNKLWESIDSISGTETALDAPLASSIRSGAPAAPKRMYLPSRLFSADLDGDRVDELVVLNNLVTAGGFFEGLRVFSNSEALCFAQDGDSLKLAWRTAQIGASSRDAFLDYSPGAKTLRIGVASRDKGKILSTFGEWRVLWLK